MAGESRAESSEYQIKSGENTIESSEFRAQSGESHTSNRATTPKFPNTLRVSITEFVVNKFINSKKG